MSRKNLVVEALELMIGWMGFYAASNDQNGKEILEKAHKAIRLAELQEQAVDFLSDFVIEMVNQEPILQAERVTARSLSIQRYIDDANKILSQIDEVSRT